MKHRIKYAKSGQVLNVIFNAETAQNEDDGHVLKFARKTASQGNIVKLQASK